MPKRQYLTTRVEPKVKREVKDIADREQRTVSQVVSILLSEALQARQSQKAA